jgi:L-lactate dehydrogenase complex protein LldG
VGRALTLQQDSSLQFTTTQLVEEFENNFGQLGGKTYVASGPFEAGEIAKKILHGIPKEKIIRSRLLPSIDTFVAQNVPSLSLQDTPRWVNTLERIEGAFVGITMADYGVSSVGCLVEVCYDDASRLVSSLTRTHVAFVRAQNLLKNLNELAIIVKKLLSEPSSRKPAITLISGPSRTGDIEMKVVMGVHGPHEVHAIIVKS